MELEVDTFHSYQEKETTEINHVHDHIDSVLLVSEDNLQDCDNVVVRIIGISLDPNYLHNVDI